MKRFAYILILCIWTVLSCDNELEFEMASAPDVLVLGAQFRGLDTQHTVYTAISSTNTVKKAPELSVKCFVNGKMVSEGIPVEVETEISGTGRWGRDKQTYYQSAYMVEASIKPGDLIRVTAEGGGWSASGDAAVPSAPKIASVDTLTVISDNFWQNEEKDYDFHVTLSVDDIPAEDNWYLVEAALVQDGILQAPGKEDGFVSAETRLRINSGDDPILGEGIIISNEEVLGTLSTNTFNIFSDTLFKGSKGTMSFNLDYKALKEDFLVNGLSLTDRINYTTARVTPSLEIRVFSISQEEYNYLKALGIQAMVIYNSNFIEPMTLPDNIEGGTGFIGAFSADTRAFVFPETVTDLSLL